MVNDATPLAWRLSQEEHMEVRPPDPRLVDAPAWMRDPPDWMRQMTASPQPLPAELRALGRGAVQVLRDCLDGNLMWDTREPPPFAVQIAQFVVVEFGPVFVRRCHEG